MITPDMQDRLDLLLAMKCPIFVIGDIVSLPAEADELFSPAELELLEAHILASMKNKED